MNRDFEEFRKNVSWFISSKDQVELLGLKECFQLSTSFNQTYPVLTKLILKARILNLKINNQEFILFSWTTKEGESCGWLNKLENITKDKYNLIDEHLLLLNEIGGIQESYNQPEDSLCNNQNFMFIASSCHLGIEDWDLYYKQACGEEYKLLPSFEELICFVEEANGNLTLYDSKTKKVLLFAPDHCFDNVSCLEGQPEYTFYTIDGVEGFVDYVETLANEWIQMIM
ncbi:hypothetical protein VSP10_14925 [Myroides odoratimimus]|uniref:hypothetical protein n=1 Tax=Myroides odoratimimus TaxID=76832 RepID=UPI002DBE1F96|nr:hypothetical protein [Myroides odoratimimus]MEC4054071.1 hypothetical protein [Myroides odoratimimus]